MANDEHLKLISGTLAVSRTREYIQDMIFISSSGTLPSPNALIILDHDARTLELRKVRMVAGLAPLPEIGAVTLIDPNEAIKDGITQREDGIYIGDTRILGNTLVVK